VTLATPRLLLREWRDADLEPFAALNADKRVMEHMPICLSREQSDGVASRIRAHFAEHGFGLWAVEVPGEVAFAGYIGLLRVSFDAHFTPAVEIGWRLAHGVWGRGFATEGAREVLRYGFEQLGLDEIVSFTIAANQRSWRVMDKLGMTHRAEDDFDHPLLPRQSKLCRHVLYRMRASDFRLRSKA
jgi:ribosomal-protein-alanine N-acetyltransferase